MPSSTLQIVAAAVILTSLSAPSYSSATNYCISAPNSVGPGAAIAWTGPFEVLQGSLDVRGAPAGVMGVFLVSTQSTQTPFGDGYLCVGGNVVRLGFKTTSASGTARLNLATEGDPGYVFWMTASMSPTATWKFQCLYRDVAGPLGTGFNLTDGISVAF